MSGFTTLPYLLVKSGYSFSCSIFVALLLGSGLGAATRGHAEFRKEPPVPMTIESSAFEPNGKIPRKHTCEGNDVSPPLAWHGEPASTRSFALIVDDPDAPDPNAPKMTWVHWVVYDLPASAHALSEGASRQLPAGTRQGKNDWQRPGTVVHARRPAAIATSTGSMRSTWNCPICTSQPRRSLKRR